jgi:hypothetical protein
VGAEASKGRGRGKVDRSLAFCREIAVDPRAYLAACLEWIDAHSVVRGRIAGKSLSQILGVRRVGPAGRLLVREGEDGRSTAAVRRAGDWVRRASLYGMIIRASTAWDHDGDGRLRTGDEPGRLTPASAAKSRTAVVPLYNELGTFLKTILLLPHLHRLGTSVLYVLPVVTASNLYRKGELGCPYAARNFFALDPLHADDAFGDEYGDVRDQFRLLVECAHRLGMRVMLDIAPRTAARDNDWILENPEWFYWIDRRFAADYAAPRLPGVTYLNPKPDRLHEVYDVPAVREHLAKFRFAPSITQPGKWAEFVRQARRRRPVDLVREIAKQFGVMTPPGFSDVINDHQPPWSDVTYLRLFEDHPTAAMRFLPNPAAMPPYVLFDTAKASLFPGKKSMRALWDRLADIIPFYQRFGVDGARVDMAHALPHRLERMILDRPRRRDPDVCFLAEELGTGNHAKAAAAGYNLIIGPSWWMQPRGHEGQMHRLVGELPKLVVPLIAAAETPDTPRAATRTGGLVYARQAVVINHFLPNAVPMVHSGQEVFERQPANLGLDAKSEDRYALDKRDPLYGKLAFFDRAALHWGNPGGESLTALIGAAAAWRRRFLDVLTDPGAYFAPKLRGDAKRVLATGFRLPDKGSLVMLANLDHVRSARVRLVGVPTAALGREPEVLLFLQHRPVLAASRGRQSAKPAGMVLVLVPGEALLLRC